MQAAAAQQKAEQQLREAQRISRTSAQQQRDRAQSAQQEAEQLQRQLYLTRKVSVMISSTATCLLLVLLLPRIASEQHTRGAVVTAVSHVAEAGHMALFLQWPIA
jgi:hypothetical protein